MEPVPHCAGPVPSTPAPLPLMPAPALLSITSPQPCPPGSDLRQPPFCTRSRGSICIVVDVDPRTPGQHMEGWTERLKRSGCPGAGKLQPALRLVVLHTGCILGSPRKLLRVPVPRPHQTISTTTSRVGPRPQYFLIFKSDSSVWLRLRTTVLGP